MNEKFEKKNKTVAFIDDVENDGYLKCGANEKLTEFISILAKRFDKVMRIIYRRSRSNFINNVKDKHPQNSKGYNPQRTEKTWKNKTRARESMS